MSVVHKIFRQDDPLSTLIEAPKAVVFLSCLMQLFCLCPIPGCGAAIDPANRSTVQHGAGLVVHYTCNNNHRGEWSSSPTVGSGNSKVWAINSILASFCLTCGLHISQVCNFYVLIPEDVLCIFQILEYFSHLRMYMFSKTFFYNVQSGLLEKIVWLVWSDCQVLEYNIVPL